MSRPRGPALVPVVSAALVTALLVWGSSAAPASAAQVPAVVAQVSQLGLVGDLRAPALPATVLGGEAVPAPVVTRLGRASGTPAVRVDGASRYDTAVAVSRRLAATTVREVVLASGASFPDALSAAPLAARYSGVLLLTSPTTLPPVVSAELARLRPSRITVVGGTGVVSDAVARQARLVSGAQTTLRRLQGSDRYATARAVAADFPAGVGGVVLASGESFPDGVASGPVAAVLSGPVLLSQARSLAAATAAALTRLAPARLVVAGGPSVLSPAVVSAAQQAAHRTAVRRFGADRYETSAALATYLRTLAVPSGTVVATGTDFPDALVGGVLGARLRGPVLLTSARPGGASALAATVVRLRGAPAWTTATMDFLARQEALPETRVVAYAAGYRAAVFARLYGWSDPEVGHWLAVMRAQRKPTGTYGLNVRWDAFGDGTVNPADTGYLVSMTDHVGRVLLEGQVAGVVGADEIGALVDLVMSWPRVNGDQSCLAYSSAAADRVHCVLNVNSSAAWFLRAAADQGVERAGQRTLAARLWAHDEPYGHDGWWPYQTDRLTIRQDWNHNAAMVEWQLLFNPTAGRLSLDATMSTGWTHPDPARRRYDDAMGYLRLVPFACARQSGLEAAVRRVASQQTAASETGQLALWAARVALTCG